MADKTDVMRGEFEAWARSNCWDIRRCGGQYASTPTHHTWEGYQAALQSPAVRELVEALRDCHLALQVLRDDYQAEPEDVAALSHADKALANFASIANMTEQNEQRDSHE